MKNILSELSNLDENQLIELNSSVVKQLRKIRAAKNKAAKASLNEGDTVSWAGQSGIQKGTVTAIKRKYAHVDTGPGVWRVPMHMLKKL